MSREKEFIDYLVELASPKDSGKAGTGSRDPGKRAELAALRRGASGEEHDLARVYPLVLPRAPTDPRRQEAYITVACLFGIHPTKREDLGRAVSLAEALRRLSADSASVEQRFVALLQSHREELTAHLRHCIALAKSNDIALRWDDILEALQWWDQEPARGRTPRERWAQAFWGPYAQNQQ